MLAIEGKRTGVADALAPSGTSARSEDVMSKQQKMRDGADGRRERWLLRVEEAADLLGISRSSLYNLINTKQVPSVRIGNCRRIREDQLREWVEDQSQET
jgi:excisionase family DNA binding protein